MKMEHIALNVKNPATMAGWYERHLGMTRHHSVQRIKIAVKISDGAE